MSLDKAIEHGKEKRKQYRGAKSVDPSCRNHGTCPWDKSNRMIDTLKQREMLDNDLKEFSEES